MKVLALENQGYREHFSYVSALGPKPIEGDACNGHAAEV